MRNANDPYARQKALWPVLKRMATVLYWQWVVLARLGLLRKSGSISRWLIGQFAQLEHGLRCLLVINAPRGVEGRGKLSIPKGGTRSSDEKPVGKSTRFSLTLGAFDEKAQQPPPFVSFADTSPASGGREVSDDETVSVLSSPVYGGSTGAAGDGGRLPQRYISPEHQLAQRLNAIADVFADPDAYAVRMARRIRARGWLLRAKPAMRPTNRTAPPAPALSAFPFAAPGVAATPASPAFSEFSTCRRTAPCCAG